MAMHKIARTSFRVFILSLVVVVSINAVPVTVCPTRAVRGFENYPTASCYLYERFPTQFVTAERMCRMSGGQLASISDEFINTFVAQGGIEAFGIMKVKDFWIGGHNLHNQSRWEWVDNLTWNYTNWYTNEPSNVKTDRCLGMQLDAGMWQAENCFVRKPYVCALEIEHENTTTSSSPISSTLQSFVPFSSTSPSQLSSSIPFLSSTISSPAVKSTTQAGETIPSSILPTSQTVDHTSTIIPTEYTSVPIQTTTQSEVVTVQPSSQYVTIVTTNPTEFSTTSTSGVETTVDFVTTLEPGETSTAFTDPRVSTQASQSASTSNVPTTNEPLETTDSEGITYSTIASTSSDESTEQSLTSSLASSTTYSQITSTATATSVFTFSSTKSSQSSTRTSTLEEITTFETDDPTTRDDQISSSFVFSTTEGSTTFDAETTSPAASDQSFGGSSVTAESSTSVALKSSGLLIESSTFVIPTEKFIGDSLFSTNTTDRSPLRVHRHKRSNF